MKLNMLSQAADLEELRLSGDGLYTAEHYESSMAIRKEIEELEKTADFLTQRPPLRSRS